MLRIDHGWEPRISPDGALVAHGYEQIFTSDPRTGASRRCPLSRVHYHAGWKSAREVGVLSEHRVFIWHLDDDEMIEQPLPPSVALARAGYDAGGLWVFTTDHRLFLNNAEVGQHIDGPVWASPFWIAASYPHYSHTVLMLGSQWVNAWSPLRPWAAPHVVDGRAWVATAYGGAEVMAPDGTIRTVPDEGRGPVVRLPSGEIICFSVFFHDETPYAIGRPWDTFTPEGAGYLLPGMGHQALDAVVCQDGILVAAWKNDSTAETTIALVPFDAPRRPRPTATPPTPPRPVPTPTPPSPHPTPPAPSPAPPEPPEQPQEDPTPKRKPSLWNVKAWLKRWWRTW